LQQFKNIQYAIKKIQAEIGIKICLKIVIFIKKLEKNAEWYPEALFPVPVGLRRSGKGRGCGSSAPDPRL